MDIYPWWTEEHKAFAEKVTSFAQEILPRDEECRWTREFPWDIFERIAAEGITGAGVPKEYGGLGLGATGACIAAEALNRMPGTGRLFVGNMLGGAAPSHRIRFRRTKKSLFTENRQSEKGRHRCHRDHRNFCRDRRSGCGNHCPPKGRRLCAERQKTVHRICRRGQPVHGLCAHQ